MLGPTDATRSFAAEALLPGARSAAAAAGVTRLADLTRLDRLGLPVWQAVRPMSRALSVHQGKGASEADAQLGALLEAVESHLSETFEAEGPVCALASLPDRERAPTLTDFARDRQSPPPDGAYRWVTATNLLTGECLYVPFDVISMDLTRDIESPFERSSNGVAAGASLEEAIAVALHEAIERDSVVEWQARGLIGCTADTLRLDTVPFEWLQLWRDRMNQAAIALRAYRVPSLTGTPVIVCELNDSGKTGRPYRAVHGRGCHPVPEVALFKALVEAIQARVTYIAGAREDILPSAYSERPGTIAVAFGFPLPPSMPGVGWDEIGSGPCGTEAVGNALAHAGYNQIGVIELGCPESIFVVRVIAIGLGSIIRRRRPVPQ